jgi:hypothetical protein
VMRSSSALHSRALENACVHSENSRFVVFLLHPKQEIFNSPNRCVFSLEERDDRGQKDQQFLDQLRVALIKFALFDAIDEPLDLGRISGRDVIVVFHGRRSRRSYARQRRTPRLELKYFLFS